MGVAKNKGTGHGVAHPLPLPSARILFQQRSCDAVHVAGRCDLEQALDRSKGVGSEQRRWIKAEYMMLVCSK